MRCLYREKEYYCGDYLDVDIFPVYRYQKSRSKKAKPTTKVQERLNQINAEKQLVRLINANFTDDDIRFDLTYRPGFHPADDETAQRDLQNYLRRVKRLAKKLDLEFKYISSTEKGTRKGRYHHHILMSGGIPIKELARLWGKGYTEVKPLQPDEFGLAGIAKYLVKNPIFGKRWNASRNLKKPEPRQRDGRLSARRVLELASLGDDTTEFSKIYEGYILADCRPFYNEINGGTYLNVRMYRDKSYKKPPGRKRKAVA